MERVRADGLQLWQRVEAASIEASALSLQVGSVRAHLPFFAFLFAILQYILVHLVPSLNKWPPSNSQSAAAISESSTAGDGPAGWPNHAALPGQSTV